MLRVFLAGWVALMCFCTNAQDTVDTPNTNKDKIVSKPYVLPWTHEISFHSDIQQQDYHLIVRFPSGYQESETGFPVIYILDGQYHFTLVSGAHGNYAWDGTIEKAMTVGITWAGENINVEQMRFQNFTPSESPAHKPSGGADTFIRVLKNEIIPFIEGHYKTNGNRTITGSSLSGLFALYVMTKEPDLFNNIVALSPSLWWQNREVETLIKTHFAKTDVPAVRLYSARGEYELYGMKSNDALFESLNAQDHKNLSIRYDIVKGAGHSGVNPIGFAQGMRFVFGKNDLEIPKESKQQMVGDYISEHQYMPKTTLKSDAIGLYLVDPAMNKIYIRSHSSSEYYINEFNANLRFSDLKDGQYHTITVSPHNQDDIVFTRQ
ncbi:alpha/beta hydrolase [Agaribacter flavus]|uniref:Alpha/beta hydrolase n=1 Tax=Agaribacter flavus TaxID=1902781 RepID=A0ABV7FMP2_9ALTE